MIEAARVWVESILALRMVRCHRCGHEAPKLYAEKWWLRFRRRYYCWQEFDYLFEREASKFNA